jgi:DNA topoisomerase-1
VARSLVIVESPAKAKTINHYLGSGYVVKASMGHVCDLPQKKLGVDIKKDFEPTYQVIPEKKKLVVELKKAAREAERVILAADPDREGEAICWHLSQLIKDDNSNVFRAVFHEVTRDAVQAAFEKPGSLDKNLIDAQQTRRILDRLVGYLISPLLWKKIGKGLSAGRVQSVALRLICEREKEIKAFKPEEYWTLTALLRAQNPPEFKAGLAKVDGKKVRLKNEAQAREAQADCEKAAFVLKKVTVREKRKTPAPPFITSTLQQEAFRILHYPVKKTMSVAQRLYEGLNVGEAGQTGLITYMRTDSIRVSEQAAAAARKYIEQAFSPAYVPAKPHVFKNPKKSQDAHEAIRPTRLDLPPEKIKSYLKKDEYDLYRLVWNRFLASQMAPALVEETEFEILASRRPQAGAAAAPGAALIVEAGAKIAAKKPVEYLFKAKGEVVKFDGFLAVFPSNGNDKELLPKASEGEELRLVGLDTKQNFTQPPPRYTEGTLVKELESRGIGRPSTYAPIISTLQDRTYVVKEKGKFRPTDLGMYVTNFLIKHFEKLMDYEFTARMEEELDQVEEGGRGWVESLREFYGLLEKYLKGGHESESITRTGIPIEEKCPKCGRGLVIKSGRFGRFKSCSGYPECDYRESLVKKEVKVLEEKCPKCGSPLVQRFGRYGAFVACSNYPACEYIKKENSDTGVACPLGCGGKVMRRKTRRGKFFYGCSRYPECKFASWDEPVVAPCPSCGAPVLYRKVPAKGAPCLYCKNEKCGWKEKAGDAGKGSGPEKGATPEKSGAPGKETGSSGDAGKALEKSKPAEPGKEFEKSQADDPEKGGLAERTGESPKEPGTTPNERGEPGGVGEPADAGKKG